VERSLTLAFGPVLFFRGARAGAWRLCALIVVAAGEQPAPLATDAAQVRPERLAARCGHELWRYDFALPLPADGGSGEYRIGGRSWQVHLPAQAGPLHIAYTACNGSEKGNTWDDGEERNERWLHLTASHAERPFHLLLQGGDQIYADPLWDEVPALAAWRRQPQWRRKRAAFPPELAEAVADDYFKRYCWFWGQPELASILASVPSLMMWDDHDIFDGWGSWSNSWLRCPTFRGIYAAAREHFALFQLAARPDALPEGFGDRRGGHFGWAYRIGAVGLVAPDLRSERTRERVLSEPGRTAFRAALECMADCRQVLLVSSMPLVTPRLIPLEWFFRVLPGHQTWQDDLIDQWPSAAHWDEWADLLQELIAFAARTGARITSVSGEIHLGALGLIESRGTRIYQLTSSGIVHPPPPASVVRVLEWVGARPARPAPALSACLLPLPGLDKRFLRARNWLEIELSGDAALTATWHSEGPLPPCRLALAAPPCPP
jgi:PhoD related phosphatase